MTNQTQKTLAEKIKAYFEKKGIEVSEKEIAEGIKYGSYLRTPAKIADFILVTR